MWWAFITSFHSVSFFAWCISKCWVSPGAFRAERLLFFVVELPWSTVWSSDFQLWALLFPWRYFAIPGRHCFVVTLGGGKLLASSSQRLWLFFQLLCLPPCSLFSDHKVLLWDLAQSSHSVMTDSLWPQGLQYARLPCSSPTPGAYSNSCPLSQWCHPTISLSVMPFSSCLQ